ncbi:MAG: glucose-1-phosphate cytidylyltransferase [Gammaproteobacteria bacterium]
MKAVILAGGLGTRISEETNVRPKPMVDIGGMPVIWHIMKTYSHFGIHDFVVLCGYKGHVIKQFFAEYAMRTSSVEVDLSVGTVRLLDKVNEPWKITLVDTGESTMTGGRIRRAKDYIGDDTFMLTYGDGVSNVDLRTLLQLHKEDQSLVTLTAVQPPGRFGALALSENQSKVTQFYEKPEGDGAWINGGYFVVEPEAINYIDGDHTSWEQGPLDRIANVGGLSAYKHPGFWQPMDTLRDKHYLESLWSDGNPPWKVW